MVNYRPDDRSKAWDVVRYLRMSGDQQNKRSPDQQNDVVDERLQRCNLPWVTNEIYRDEAKSGRMLRNRPDFNRMLADLKSGIVRARYILVDTIERFGRNEDLDELRRRLFRKYGISVLCADQDFADPNTQNGEAAALLENFRARADGRVKRHNVIRGKKDKIRLGFWPGSKPPFGFELHVVRTEQRGDRLVKHSHLVHHEVTSQIARSVFMKSVRNPSMGQGALAKWLNERSDISDEFKPFHADTVGRWLCSPIYTGELVWAEFSTDIVDDMRVLERNPDDEVMRVPNFCEPIIEKAIFDQVGQFREARRTNRPKTDVNTHRQVGMTYNYMLTGLVRCGTCGGSMVPNGSSAYVTSTGEERRYVSYMCAKSNTGLCTQKARVKEAWLRETVIDKLRERLFPADSNEGGPTWMTEIVDLVKSELERMHSERDVSRPTLEREMAQLEEQTIGWSVSLAKAGLAARLRQEIESNYDFALGRISEIQSLLNRQDSEFRQVSQIVNPTEVASRLERLSDVLSEDCPTLCNLMLSMHIESIVVSDDGQIVMRTCKLGSCPESMHWCGEHQAEREAIVTSKDRQSTQSRRRVRIATDDLAPGNEDTHLREIAEHVTNPNRFAGMPDNWFWTDRFLIPEKSCWSKDNASAVLERYLELQSETGKKPSCNVLAKEFGKSRPTILAALDAVEAGDSKQSTHRREATVKVKGNLEVEARIEEMHDAGFLEKEIAVDVGVSRSTITLALSRLYEKRGLPKPDGRLVRHQHGPSEDSIYVRHGAKAFELWQAGKSLRAIGTELGICDITAKQSIAYWCRQHDLPEPTVESRRQEWIDQAVAAVSAGASINEVARQLKKSPATIRSWLAER